MKMSQLISWKNWTKTVYKRLLHEKKMIHCSLLVHSTVDKKPDLPTYLCNNPDNPQLHK